MSNCFKSKDISKQIKIDKKISKNNEDFETYSSPEDDLKLAGVYIKEFDGTDIKKLQIALDKLIPHRDYFADNAFWHYQVGKCFFYLDLAYLSIPYFNKALELDPFDQKSTKALFYCELELAAPLFKRTKNFMTRIDTMWSTFAKYESIWRQKCDKDGLSTELLAEIKSQCDLIFAPFVLSCFINVDSEHEYKYRLIFNVSNQLNLLIPLKYLLKHIPNTVKQYWQIYAGLEQISTNSIKRDKLLIESQDLSLKLIPTKGADSRLGFKQNFESDRSRWQKLNAQYILAVHHQNMTKLKTLAQNSGKEEDKVALGNFYDACLELIYQNIGEKSSCHAFCEIGMVADFKNFANIAADTLTLDQLAQKLNEQDYNLNLSLDDLIKAQRYDYTYQTQVNSQKTELIREDIFEGYTYCKELIFDYANQDVSLVNLLHSIGASAGFFAYKLKVHNNNTNISKERQNLQKAFIEAIDTFDGIEVIGAAYGFKYDYIDIFCGGFYPNLFQNMEAFINKNTDLFENVSFYAFRQGFFLNLYGEQQEEIE